jgi:hypothetical protein
LLPKVPHSSSLQKRTIKSSLDQVREQSITRISHTITPPLTVSSNCTNLPLFSSSNILYKSKWRLPTRLLLSTIAADTAVRPRSTAITTTAAGVTPPTASEATISFTNLKTTVVYIRYPRASESCLRAGSFCWTGVFGICKGYWMHGILRGGILGVKGKELNGMSRGGVAQKGAIMYSYILIYSE